MSAELFSEPEEEIPGPALAYAVYLTAEQLSTIRYVLQHSKSSYEFQLRNFRAFEAIGEVPPEEPGTDRWLEELVRDIAEAQQAIGGQGVPSEPYIKLSDHVGVTQD